MKKSVLVLLFLIIANLIVIANAQSQISKVSLQGAINPDTGLPEDINKLKETGEKLTDEEQRKEYLKQEWGKILEKNKYFGPIIEGYRKISPYTDPIFKYTVGMTPSLSWLFVLALVIWICLAIYIFRILELFSIVSEPIQYLIFIATIIGISFIKISLKLAEFIINKISLFTTWWIQLIGVGIIIIILVVASVFSKQLKEFFEKAKERRAKMKEEANRMELEKNAKVSSILAKSAS